MVSILAVSVLVLVKMRSLACMARFSVARATAAMLAMAATVLNIMVAGAGKYPYVVTREGMTRRMQENECRVSILDRQ